MRVRSATAKPTKTFIFEVCVCVSRAEKTKHDQPRHSRLSAHLCKKETRIYKHLEAKYKYTVLVKLQ